MQKYTSNPLLVLNIVLGWCSARDAKIKSELHQFLSNTETELAHIEHHMMGVVLEWGEDIKEEEKVMIQKVCFALL